jgi:hypothetical protein
VAVSAGPPLAELLEEVRPLARRIAATLVREELTGLATSLNGDSAARAQMPARPHDSPDKRTRAATKAANPPTRVCATCGQRPAAPGRTICYGCRERQRKERRQRQAAAVSEDLPHPGGPADDVPGR